MQDTFSCLCVNGDKNIHVFLIYELKPINLQVENIIKWKTHLILFTYWTL